LVVGRAAMVCLKLHMLANVAAALRLPASSVGTAHQQLGRRAFAATALGSLPVLLTPGAAHAGFATKVEDISEERLAELAKNRQNFGDSFAFKIVCGRDDEECLRNKREMASPANLFKSTTSEERSQAIIDQATACRGMCSRPDIRMRCERDDTECLEKKKALQEELGVGNAGKDFVPVVGVILAAIAGRAATRPEKTDNPKGMQIREAFYTKRKEDTVIAEKIGLKFVNAANAGQIARARKAMAEEQKAAEAAERNAGSDTGGKAGD